MHRIMRTAVKEGETKAVGILRGWPYFQLNNKMGVAFVVWIERDFERRGLECGEGPFRKKSVSFRHRRKDCGLPALSFERSIKRRRGGRVGSWAGAVTVVLELNTPNGKGRWCTYQLEFCTGE